MDLYFNHKGIAYKATTKNLSGRGPLLIESPKPAGITTDQLYSLGLDQVLIEDGLRSIAGWKERNSKEILIDPNERSSYCQKIVEEELDTCDQCGRKINKTEAYIWSDTLVICKRCHK
jgi:hypothetical protein